MTDNATSLRLKAVDSLALAQVALANAAASISKALLALEAGPTAGGARHHVLAALGPVDEADVHLEAANAMLAKRDNLLSGPPTSQTLDKLAAALDVPQLEVEAMTTHGVHEVFVVPAWKRLPLADTGLVGTEVRVGSQVRRIAMVLRIAPIEPGERIGLVFDQVPAAKLSVVS